MKQGGSSLPAYPKFLEESMVAAFDNFSLYAANIDDSIDLVGRVKKTSRYRKKQRIDFEFQAILDKYAIGVQEYGFALGNLQTSFNSINKYKTKNFKYKEEPFLKAKAMLRQSYSVVSSSRLVMDFSDWVRSSSSPGYPYTNLYRTKKEAMADDRVMLFCTNKVYSAEPPCGLWSIACKMEPKKFAKILTNNTRTIVSAPLDVMFEAHFLFSEMNSNIHHAGKCFKIPSTVATSHFYLGWHDLYSRLYRDGRNAFGLAIDYTEYDGSCSIDEFQAVKEVRFSNYVPILQTPEIWQRLSNYYDEIVHTCIVMETGDVVRKHIGNPSGQLNTLTDNGLINELRWYYLWNVISPLEKQNLESFREHCELLVCGDDSIITVDFEARQWFQPHLIKEVSVEMGWFFKFESPDYMPLHTLSYCSKSFMWYFGYVISVPNNPEKQLASILYGTTRVFGSDDDFHREVLSRLLGIRMESYFLIGFRTIIEEYVNFLFNKYDVQLRRIPSEDMPSFADLLVMRRDHVSMMSLFLADVNIDERSWHPHVRGNIPPFSNNHIVDVKFGEQFY